MVLLVPSDPLHPRRPDEHFADEAAAAATQGALVALVDHDALVRGDAEAALARVAPADVTTRAVYRGWMLRAEEYAAFEACLAAKGLVLRTDASMFRRAHELPGWYAALAAFTPESVWTKGRSEAAFRERCAQLGAGPAVLRDESFVGGLVLRRFESFRPDEVRTWWIDGDCVLRTVHPDSTARDIPEGIDLSALTPVVRDLALPFVTVDLALRADGAWRVMELGDGQVSDRPRITPADQFLNAILADR